MKIHELLNKISLLSPVKKDYYSLLNLNGKTYYYGKNWNNEIVFIIKCVRDSAEKYVLTTNELRLDINRRSEFIIDEKTVSEQVNILTCTTNIMEKQTAFLRLCHAFITTESDGTDIMSLFSALVSLFSIKDKSPNKLQGLFGELYVMHFFEQRNVNLFQYWQKEDYRTHDFYITEKNRVEVKSTSKDVRKHHFKHEQIMSEIHDVKVISIFTKRADKGLSLFDIVENLDNTQRGDGGFGHTRVF